MVDKIISYPTSTSGIIVLLKRSQNIENSSRLVCKNNRFSACVFNFEQTRTVTIFGEHGKMTIMADISNDSVFNEGNINCVVSSEIVMASIYLMFNSVS